MVYKVPFFFTIFCALAIAWIGINGQAYVPTCTSALCNSIRSLEWETLTAGFFGLAGGLAVLWATRTQIASQRKAAVDLELLDIDSFISELSKGLTKLIEVTRQASENVQFDDAECAGKANMDIKEAANKIETGLLFEIDKNHRFPASLRRAARYAHENTLLVTSYRFGVTKGKMDYTIVTSTQQGLDEWAQKAFEPLDELKFERCKYSDFLMRR
ncbi:MULTISPECIES: hypothetical protein [Thalassospira]|uniref:Uncharacterized protein n=2 Tax=Thalassospira TaxID=168934 RepID=A0A367W5T2_9PROT|nr:MULTISPECIES: hypothetical protein [Thalassospira]MDG4721136.1 hypothetical protein [Thalassospira sp. FZY0004]RCK36786.1 hypothetical protein TH19_12780 [Thalassospira profundimaris]